MAIVVRGRTRCRLCGRAHEADDDLELFPHLFGPGHPAHEVSDAGVHLGCLLRQPYAEHALADRAAWAVASYDYGPVTAAALTEAGWTPRRVVDRRPAVAALTAAGYAGAGPAVARLGSLLGLTLRHPHPAAPGSLRETSLDPAPAAAGVDRETVESWARRVGGPVWPVGAASHATLVVDEAGAVYAGFDDSLVVVGASVEEAVERLCTEVSGEQVPD